MLVHYPFHELDLCVDERKKRLCIVIPGAMGRHPNVGVCGNLLVGLQVFKFAKNVANVG